MRCIASMNVAEMADWLQKVLHQHHNIDGEVEDDNIFTYVASTS